MSDLLDYYLNWPYKCICPHALYKRVRKCMVLDRPKWISADGWAGGRKPYKMSNGEHKLFAHFPEQEYVDALKAIIQDYETDPIFVKLRADEFNSLGQHRQQTNFVSEDRYSDLSAISFDGEFA